MPLLVVEGTRICGQLRMSIQMPRCELGPSTPDAAMRKPKAAHMRLALHV